MSFIIAPKMMWIVLVFGLSAIGIPMVEPAGTYLVTVSSQVVSGSRETLCYQVQNNGIPHVFSLELTVGNSRTTLLDLNHHFPSHYDCLSFQVPTVVTETVAFLHVVLDGGSTSKEQTKILIQPSSNVNLIRTDKPIYKPGQKVQFRVVSLDSSFVPHNQMYRTVELQDPKSNRIAQWLNQPTVSGILDLAHSTSPEAAPGLYTIITWNEQGHENRHKFEIKEYVLPKYEVEVHLPSFITILDTRATLTVCGKYTFGRPVQGDVKATVCRDAAWYAEMTDICEEYEMRMNKMGCATQVLDLTRFALRKWGFDDLIHVKAELAEQGTGVVLKGTGEAEITNLMRTVTFVDVPSLYQHNVPWPGGKIKVTAPDGSPVVNERVQLIVEEAGGWLEEVTSNHFTDHLGLVSFSMDTSNRVYPVTLQAKSEPREEAESQPGLRQPWYSSAYKRVEPYSKVHSTLKLQAAAQSFPCDTDATVTAIYHLHELDFHEVHDFFYIVSSRGRVVQHGRLPVTMINLRSLNHGELTVPLRSLADLSPYAQVLVWTVTANGEVVADSMDFPIQLCLKNKVSLRFSSPQELPGGKTVLSLQAAPGSLCSLKAIDQSVLLLRPEDELSLASVFQSLPVQKLSYYHHLVEEYSDCFSDVRYVFKHVGMKILTNLNVREECFGGDVGFSEGSSATGLVNPEIGPARTYFPDTWIWELVPVVSGSVTLEKTVPDTITKWSAEAFCTSSVGLGLAPSVELTAFQPFFVSLTLPYSVVRGEVFTLRATVFNYLSECIMVKVTLSDSDQFRFWRCFGCPSEMFVPAEESRTFEWVITATTMGEASVKVSAEALNTERLCGTRKAVVPKTGHIDKVVRTMLVEAEGTPDMTSHNALLCPEAHTPLRHPPITLSLPEEIIEGSVNASVSVLGDLMGRAMKNLASLLVLPTGCGEQTMAKFTPNVFILAYLKSTDQLSPGVHNKAVQFLESGYQNELKYKRHDCSYSAFSSDESGNTWLTAFVMKSFGKAQSYIYIDTVHITEAKAWLASHQGDDGCYNSVGRLLNNRMKGGVSDKVTLTAYITAALLEMEDRDPMVQEGLRCLKSTMLTGGLLDANLYTTALISYTFSLANEALFMNMLLVTLDQKATFTAGTTLGESTRYWKGVVASGTHADPIEVETAAYVLLALLSGPPVRGFGLHYASTVARWLVQQQNSQGGFSSTQDTVVGLQALAKFAAITYSPSGSTKVTVRYAGRTEAMFKVDQHNNLLYQEQPLRERPKKARDTRKYNILAEGDRCVFLQMTLRYNFPPPPDALVFDLESTLLGKCNTWEPIKLEVVVSYVGPRSETNMVLIDVKLLSGVSLVKNSLEPKDDGNVKRVEQNNEHVVIYLDKLERAQSQSYTLLIQQDILVLNLKPAAVKVFDYYQPSDDAVTEYSC